MESKSKLLESKVVLITGSNRGIGKAILESFAQEGAIIYACARSDGSLDKLAEELAALHSTSIRPVYFDVNDSSLVKEVFLRIKREENRLDCVVNNAGIMIDAVLEMISKEMLEELFNTNVFSMISLSQYAAKLMKRQKSGSIINISSVIGTKGNSGQIAYAATKGAVISLTKASAKELASNNIRVNSIAPGVINTDLLNKLNQEDLKLIIDKIGIGRIGTPNDVAEVAVFLASDLSKYVTGQIIEVEGSWLV
jgi:3-oxoacyl-[acyl-carrier protein] reductase